MSATLIINRWTGAAGSPTKTNITSINTRVNAYDGHSTNGTTSPVAIPASMGQNNSFWCVTQLHCSVAPATLVNNIKWFPLDSSNPWTGVTMVVNTATSYIQATGTVGTSGTILTTGNYSTLAGTPVSAFTYNSGSPLSVAGSTSTTGDFGDFVVYQFQVQDNASAGAIAQEVVSWQYDEL